MASIAISHIVPASIVDGPGVRTSLYTQGCSIGRSNPCKGCQNTHLFPEAGGTVRDVEELAGELLATGLPITLIGGEPLDQAEPLSYLIELLKDAGRHVIIYSGYTWEELIRRATTEDGQGIALCLIQADLLVDGRFIRDLDRKDLQWRGSTNQRPILLRETFAWGRLVLDDWDSEQEIVIDHDGSIQATEATIDLLFPEEGTLARRCGMTRGRVEPGIGL